MIEIAFEIMKHQNPPVPGCFCEFGVWRGDGLGVIAALSKEKLKDQYIPIYGFDSFEGMPPTEVKLTPEHAHDWREGRYSEKTGERTSAEEVSARFPGMRIIKGVFADLKPLREYGIQKVRFARLDCDIYEGYRDALRLLTPHLSKGSLLLFDEGVAPDDPRYHDSIENSGVRAINEWIDDNDSCWELRKIKSHWTEMLCEVIGGLPF